MAAPGRPPTRRRPRIRSRCRAWDLAWPLAIGLGLVLAAGCGAPPAASLAAATPAAPPTLRYAVFPAPPYMIGAADESTPLSGIDVEIVQALAAQLGARVEPIRCTWARCLELMKAGEADLLSSVYKKPEREAFMAYLDAPYLDRLPIAFYFLKSKPYTIETYADLYTLPSIGVLREASYFEPFDQDLALAKVEVASQDQLFPMLLHERVAAMAGYVPTENYRLATEGYRDKIQISTFVYNETAEVYLALSRKSPWLDRLAEISRWHQQLLADQTVARIVTAYYDRYR